MLASSCNRIPVQWEPNAIHHRPSALNTCGSMALYSSTSACEVTTGPWSSQLSRSPGVRVDATPMAEVFCPNDDAA